jgi:hypothetical protein
VAGKGYTRVVDIGLLMGVDLTALQQQQLGRLLPAAEAMIDAATHAAWKTGAITTERHPTPGPRLYLRSYPVTSITTVEGWATGAAAYRTLQEVSSGYTIESLTDGVLALGGGVCYDVVRVAYLPETAVPAAISEATARLAWTWLSRDQNGVGGDVKAFTVFDQLQMTYRDPVTMQRALPPDVWALVAPYARHAVVLA